jgi:hypothetical protein
MKRKLQQYLVLHHLEENLNEAVGLGLQEDVHLLDHQILKNMIHFNAFQVKAETWVYLELGDGFVFLDEGQHILGQRRWVSIAPVKCVSYNRTTWVCIFSDAFAKTKDDDSLSAFSN